MATLTRSQRPRIWSASSPAELPNKQLGELEEEVFASYSGPDSGLTLIYDLENGNVNCTSPAEELDSPGSTDSGPQMCVAGCSSWRKKSRKAYGICMSLYDQHPVNGRISGDPIADAFALCARKNSSVMIVADGVNWGEKSKMAARCAIYGSMMYLNQNLYSKKEPVRDTSEVFTHLLEALRVAHEFILKHEAGLTTLCLCFVCPLQDSKQFMMCVVNVGDSLAYVFSKHFGVREITTGSHNIQQERDIRDAMGAIGPVNGTNPELHNLTCSMTAVDRGDIIFLTTDGISDNFDPVVTKIAVPKKVQKDEETGCEIDHQCGTSIDGKPEMEPHERHQYAVKEMERVIHEFELFTEGSCSAQELCGAILQHVLKLTDPKRKVLENPELYGKKLKSSERKRRDSEIVSKMSRAPGKLDHATIIGFEAGNYHGNDDEEYSESDEEEIVRPHFYPHIEKRIIQPGEDPGPAPLASMDDL